MEIIIDGLKIKSEDDFHHIIAKEMSLPDWYGKNLDALWDVLTGMAIRPLKITWINSKQSEKILGRYKEIINLLKEVENQDKSTGMKEIFELELK